MQDTRMKKPQEAIPESARSFVLAAILVSSSLLLKDGLTQLLLGGRSFDGRSLGVKILLLGLSFVVTAGSFSVFAYGLCSSAKRREGLGSFIRSDLGGWIREPGNIAWLLVVMMIALNVEYSGPKAYYSPNDLDSFLSSGRAALAGANPYSALTSQGITLFNRNPPVVVLAFMPLARFSLEEVLPFMRAISALFMMLSVLLLYTSYHPRPPLMHVAALIAASGHWIIYASGQIYTFLVFCIAAAWILMGRKRYILAGICIGIVVAVKPSFALWPAMLLLAGAWELSLAAFVSAGLITLLPAPFLGSQVYLQWMKANSGPFVEEGYWLPENMSAFSIGVKWGVPWLGYAIIAAVLLYVLFWIRRSRPSMELVCQAALVVSVLASPLGWTMYVPFFLPLYLTQHWDRTRIAAAVLFMIPGAVFRDDLSRISPVVSIVFGAVNFVACLLLLWSVFAPPQGRPDLGHDDHVRVGGREVQLRPAGPE
jgi:hypothetical protein